MPQPIKLGYATAKSNAGPRLTPARLGWLAVLGYLVVFILLTIIGTNVKDAWAMNLQLVVLVVGPIIALVVMAWSAAQVRRTRDLGKHAVALLPLLFLTFLWSVHYSSYRNFLREIESIRAVNTIVWPGPPEHAEEANPTPRLDPSRTQEP